MSSHRLNGSSTTSAMPREQASHVIRILDNYLSELENGREPHPDELIGQHPELADVLRAYLDKLDVLHHAATGLRATAPIEETPPEHALAERGRLGDFRIIREVGRGGMGIVYEADQISLGRRVALKVLPFATTLDAKQLQRFKNEAQAAAHLHHTHIVPVHAVGCERGVHYYAMQFIEGQTVAAMIEELRHLAGLMPESAADSDVPQGHGSTVAFLSRAPAVRPAVAVDTKVRLAAHTTKRSTKNPGYFRTVAELGVQAAEALEHAHRMGIIHRDIKPANLLVDAQVHLWITDFGLARSQTDGGLTLSGDILGTIRYMSPEQALAKRFQVDHRTDIYSLGVTLYELLTLRPAFDGNDRHELLRQIAFEDPQAARRVNAAIPEELETIVLKAMCKEPDGRYGTAQELADDLRRFLEHKPILARRPTLREMFRKWAIRHKPIVAGAASLLMLAMAALVVHGVLIWREKELTKDALSVAAANAAKAAARAEAAELQRERAVTNFRQSRVAVTELLRFLDEKRWSNIAGITALRRDLAEKAIGFFQSILKEDSSEPDLRFDAGMAYAFMANVCRVQGERSQAERNYNKAVRLFESLVADFPNDDSYRGELAVCYHTWGGHLHDAGQVKEGSEFLRKAAEHYQASLRNNPTARALNNFAWFLATCPEAALRDLGQSLALAERALEIAPRWGECYNTLGVVYYRVGQWDKAVQTLKESMKRRAGGDAFDWFFLAMAYFQMNDRGKANHWYDYAVRELGKTNAYIYEDVYRYQTEAAKLLGKELPKHKGCAMGCE